MKITKVTLQNFRGIGSLELDFPIDQNIIALVGVNGVGKSSILDSICILLRGLSTLIKFTINIGTPEVKDVTFPHLSEDNDIRTQQKLMYCGAMLSEGNHDFYSLNISRSLGDMVSRIYDYDVPNSMPEKLFIYYSCSRKSTVIKSVFDRNKHGELTVLKECDESSGFDDFFLWFKAIEDIENEERLESNSAYRDKRLESVRNAVSAVLGDGFSKLRVKRITNNLIVSKDGDDIPVNLLSDGEKSLIALVSDLAKRLADIYSNLENPLDGDGIVLIDEIELHMHPTWQRMIIPRLTKTFPNCQFIITTHSPQVLSHVQPESIYLLKKVGEDIVVTKPQYSYGRDSNRILEDLMDETERPAEIQDQLGELFSLIHQGHLSEAQQLVEQLSETIGASEPELGKAEVMIKRQEIIGR
jgi:predicted ATP-binding protein involved in virulence